MKLIDLKPGKLYKFCAFDGTEVVVMFLEIIEEASSASPWSRYEIKYLEGVKTKGIVVVDHVSFEMVSSIRFRSEIT